MTLLDCSKLPRASPSHPAIVGGAPLMGVARIAGQHLWWARAGPVAREAAIVGAGAAEVNHRTGNEMQRKIKMKARRLALPRGIEPLFQP